LSHLHQLFSETVTVLITDFIY